ncbi:hypothetical protein BGX21_006837 [Mortierella sp. AD011]|nr:hypothetical protein BGX21_006837 [Mortierella sp. AD011]
MRAGAMGMYNLKLYGEPVVTVYQDGHLLRYYIVEADPEEEIKKNCSLYSPSEGPGTTGNQV